MVAANPGEAARQVATLQELVNHLRNNRPQEAEAGLVFFGINGLEVVVVAVSALPQGRLSGISGAIDLHGSIGQPHQWNNDRKPERNAS